MSVNGAKSSKESTVVKQKPNQKCDKCYTSLMYLSLDGKECGRLIACEKAAKRRKELLAEAERRRRSVLKKG